MSWRISSKFRIGQKIFDVSLLAGEKIVYTEDLCATFEELLAEMRAKKTSATGHQNTLVDMHRTNPVKN